MIKSEVKIRSTAIPKIILIREDLHSEKKSFSLSPPII